MDSKPLDCESKSIDFRVINIEPSCQVKIIDSKLEDRFLVINSKKELEGSVIFGERDSENPCQELENDFSELDFTKNTLLIGKKVVQGIQANLISQQVYQICTSDEITYSAEIRNGNYTAIGIYIFAVIVPKHYGNVQFDIKISNKSSREI